MINHPQILAIKNKSFPQQLSPKLELGKTHRWCLDGILEREKDMRWVMPWWVWVKVTRLLSQLLVWDLFGMGLVSYRTHLLKK
jgi:hypothetical protein